MSLIHGKNALLEKLMDIISFRVIHPACFKAISSTLVLAVHHIDWQGPTQFRFQIRKYRDTSVLNVTPVCIAGRSPIFVKIMLKRKYAFCSATLIGCARGILIAWKMLVYKKRQIKKKPYKTYLNHGDTSHSSSAVLFNNS